MAAEFTMRDAVVGDEGIVLRFIRELAEYEKRLDEVETSEADLSDALFGSEACAKAIIAEVDGAPVGFALYYKTFSTFAGKPGYHLEDLYVTPEARGGGIGKAVLAEIAARTLAMDGRRMEWTALDWNTPAIEFYKRLGADHLSDWLMFRLSGDALEAFKK